MIWRTFRRRPLRKLLTLTQLLLGCLATTLALSPFLTPVDTSRDDLFYLTSGSRSEDGVMFYSLFKEEHLAALRALAPAAKEVAVYARGWGDAELVANGKRYAFDPQASVTVSPSFLAMSPPVITSGSAFSRADAGEAVVLLSDDSARRIFGDEEAVGQTLLKTQSNNFYTQDLPPTSPTPYRVVGTFADTANTLDTTPGIIYPAWAPESFTAGGSFDQLLVQARPGQGEAARAQMLAAVRQEYRDDLLLDDVEVGQDFFITDVADFMNGEAPFNPNLVILALFGAVSLAIGSVGLFSTTLLEVLERTHEIGLKRALGAGRAAVCREFMLEAATLSFFGAVLGAGAAALLSAALAEPLGDAFFYGLRFVWAWGAAALVVAAGVALGALAGLFPALNATRSAPVASLRNPPGGV